MAFNCYLKLIPSGYSGICCAIDGDCLKFNCLTLLLPAMLSNYQAAARHTPGYHIHALLHVVCANQALTFGAGIIFLNVSTHYI